MLTIMWVQFVLRFVVGSTFICYGISKFWNISEFAIIIQQHQLIPKKFVYSAAITVSALEVALGLMLFFNVVPLYMSIALGMMLIAFSLLLVRIHLKPQLNIHSCGCSGSDKGSLKGAFFRNLFLLLMIIVLASLIYETKQAEQPLATQFVGILLISSRNLGSRLSSH